MPAARVENGYSNLPAMQPRPFKHCKCGQPLAPSQTYCANCVQLNKGVTDSAVTSPAEIDSPRKDLEGPPPDSGKG